MHTVPCFEGTKGKIECVYTDTDKNDKSLSIDLSAVTDIFVVNKKQEKQEKSSSLTLSFSMEGGMEYLFEAEEEQNLRAWLQGLNHIFTSSTTFTTTTRSGSYDKRKMSSSNNRKVLGNL